MKKPFQTMLFLMMFAITSNLSAQNILWSRIYGSTGDDGAFSVAKTGDGGLIVTGFISVSNLKDLMLMKTDALGNALWTRTFGGALNDFGRSVRQTNDGGFIIGGMTELSPQLFGALLIRTDSIGNILWQREFDLGDDTRGHSVWQTDDGGFILAGQAWLGSPTFGSYDIYVVKTDAGGNMQWQRTYAYNNNVAPGADIALSVRQLNDRGYIIAGHTNSTVWASYLIRTDSLGAPIWTRVYDTLVVNECKDVILTLDGGFLLVGTKVNPNTDTDVLLIKTDSSGNPVWERTYGGEFSEQANSVRQLPDGGFIIAAQTGSFGAGGYDVYVLRTKATGDTLWTRALGGASDDRGFSVELLNDGVVIAGWAWSFGQGLGDVYLLKLWDPVLEVHENSHLPRTMELLQNYPNPFNPSTKITWQSPVSGYITLKVYDVLGREVATLVDEYRNAGSYEVEFNAGQTSNLSSGVYFYKLQVGEFVQTKKMILIK
ncbi:MAG: T9SS type A sorting domain-containing protein [Ignavibacteria bacterium]|jgi:hypothetical protein|nr:T9SS type A sorting domain-containing protein [Ignavibacteria bacterium]MDH7527550.1 T9SS type A sorting domain-containing protein [Ignavibacteria bacterium]